MDPSSMKELINLGKITLPALITLVGILGGGYLGHRYAQDQAKATKGLDFLERRVREFYSPMVGCIQRLRALGEMRLEISRASNSAWGKICERAPKPFLDHEKHFEPFRKIIEYDNSQLYEDILPTYDRMVAIFTDSYWLADDVTRPYYGEFCRFVEIWHRYKAESLPYEVMQEIQHSEERLHPLYSALEATLRALTEKLAHRRSV